MEQGMLILQRSIAGDGSGPALHPALCPALYPAPHDPALHLSCKCCRHVADVSATCDTVILRHGAVRVTQN
jgi:hypothetical protein